MCVSLCKPPRHPNGEGTVIVVHFLAEGQESPHPRPGIVCGGRSRSDADNMLV